MTLWLNNEAIVLKFCYLFIRVLFLFRRLDLCHRHSHCCVFSGSCDVIVVQVSKSTHELGYVRVLGMVNSVIPALALIDDIFFIISLG